MDETTKKGYVRFYIVMGIILALCVVCWIFHDNVFEMLWCDTAYRQNEPVIVSRTDVLTKDEAKNGEVQESEEYYISLNIGGKKNEIFNVPKECYDDVSEGESLTADLKYTTTHLSGLTRVELEALYRNGKQIYPKKIDGSLMGHLFFLP